MGGTARGRLLCVAGAIAACLLLLLAAVPLRLATSKDGSLAPEADGSGGVPGGVVYLPVEGSTGNLTAATMATLNTVPAAGIFASNRDAVSVHGGLQAS